MNHFQGDSDSKGNVTLPRKFSSTHNNSNITTRQKEVYKLITTKRVEGRVNRTCAIWRRFSQMNHNKIQNKSSLQNTGDRASKFYPWTSRFNRTSAQNGAWSNTELKQRWSKRVGKVGRKSMYNIPLNKWVKADVRLSWNCLWMYSSNFLSYFCPLCGS